MKKISVMLLTIFISLFLSGCSEARHDELLVEIEPESFVIDELKEIILEINFTNVGDSQIRMNELTPDLYIYEGGKWIMLPELMRRLPAAWLLYEYLEPGETLEWYFTWPTFENTRYRHEFTTGKYRFVYKGCYKEDENREWYGEVTILP